MEFSQKEVNQLLVNCKRSCCICHRFCGIKIEVDHIHQKAEGGLDKITNAIPLCFDCDAEAHYYNDKHPRGRKYHSEELVLHRENWLKKCQEGVISKPQSEFEAGPLSGLITELELNIIIIDDNTQSNFETLQMQRAISSGILSHLDDEIRVLILKTFANIIRANSLNEKFGFGLSGDYGLSDIDDARNKLQSTRQQVKNSIQIILNHFDRSRST